jgi:hypothetical protein
MKKNKQIKRIISSFFSQRQMDCLPALLDKQFFGLAPTLRAAF